MGQGATTGWVGANNEGQGVATRCNTVMGRCDTDAMVYPMGARCRQRGTRCKDGWVDASHGSRGATVNVDTNNEGML